MLEYAMGHGQGRKQCKLIRPNIGVITTIGTAHYGRLGNSVEGIVKSKSRLIQGMSSNGLLLLNKDDENTKLLPIEPFKGKIIYVGTRSGTDYQARNIKFQDNGMTFDVKLDDRSKSFFIPLYGSYNVCNALFAVAVGHILGLDDDDIAMGLRNIALPRGRQTILELNGHRTIIDDSYNANPQSVKAALDVLSELGKTKRTIALLGNMAELGEYSEAGHKEVGAYLADKKVDYLITYGDLAGTIGEAAVGCGFHDGRVRHCTEKDALEQLLINIFKPDTIVLVKGSRVMRLDKVVDFLVEKFQSTDD